MNEDFAFLLQPKELKNNTDSSYHNTSPPFSDHIPELNLKKCPKLEKHGQDLKKHNHKAYMVNNQTYINIHIS